MLHKAIIEIGVNKAQDTIRLHKAHYKSGYKYYGFEPLQFLNNTITSICGDLENFTLVNKAIDTEEGIKEFFIQHTSGDISGCSSLNTFNTELEKRYRNRNFVYSGSENVECIRMDTFIEQNDISAIPFMHCDAQGNDLKVLQSFGNSIDKLEAGVVEASMNNSLYNIDNDITSIIEFLRSNNFVIKNIDNNDLYGLEVNIYFERK